MEHIILMTEEERLKEEGSLKNSETALELITAVISTREEGHERLQKSDSSNHLFPHNSPACARWW